MRPHEDPLPCAGAGAAEEEGKVDVCYCYIAQSASFPCLFVLCLHVLVLYRRVAQLEKKIDSLVSMIASTQQVQTSGTPPLTPESHDTSVVNDVSNIPVSQPLQNAARKSQSTQAAPNFPLAIPSDSSTTFQLIPGFSFTLEEAQSYFNIYRREFMPNYPFVIIPEDMDPRHLYATSRCLFWTIMAAVAPQSSATQQGVENWFRQYIADRMVVKQEKNLALLQAILIHLAW